MNVLLCLSHSIEEYDQLRLLSSLGVGVASIGGYIDPRHPHDPKRPALDIDVVPEIRAAVDALGTPDNLGAAQERIPDAALEWLGDDGAIIYHHYLDRLYNQWPRILDWKRGAPGRRVIWRSVGQSVDGNEAQAIPFRRDGMERVAYSPKEANIPGYSGHDAIIRFYKDPEEWKGWTGEERVVINFTQHLAQRDPYTNWKFWEAATNGLPHYALGPGSEVIGGGGEQPHEAMKSWLRTSRAYLYTGTQPASYTLGLIEAMMTGIPVVSIGPSWMRIFPYGPDLFEGHELVTAGAYDQPESARRRLERILDDSASSAEIRQMASAEQRAKAIELFGIDTIRDQWAAYLGVKVPVAA
jgi:hypothetical protein